MKLIITTPTLDLYALRVQGRIRIECTRCGARGPLSSFGTRKMPDGTYLKPTAVRALPSSRPEAEEKGETMNASKFDTLNACAVGVGGKNQVRVLMPRTLFTREEALMFAAWLVVMATFDDDADDHGEILERIRAVQSA